MGGNGQIPQLMTNYRGNLEFFAYYQGSSNVIHCLCKTHRKVWTSTTSGTNTDNLEAHLVADHGFTDISA